MNETQRLAARIAAIGDRQPGHPAVITGDLAISYGDLVGRARLAAASMSAHGLAPGEFCAITADRGAPAIAAMLGTWLAGAGFLAIEPGCPARREAAMLDAVRPRLIVAPLGGDGAIEVRAVAGVPPAVPDPGPAYAVFTSGSTGVPKGVRIGARSLGWHAAAVTQAYGLRHDDHVLHAASLMFDVSAEEIWPTLLCGATVAVLPQALGRTSYAELDRLIGDAGVTVCNLPSGYFAGWAATRQQPDQPGSPLRLVIAGSEPLPPAAAATWTSQPGSPPLIAAYGTSETTITSITGMVTSQDGPIPVGRPLPGMRAAIVGADLRELAAGDDGELILAGPGLADGYLAQGRLVDNEDGTGQRFIVRDGVRWYRTGDRARAGDGEIILLGRTDDQVKIRGRRVELGEVRAALLNCSQVRDARVFLLGDQLAACLCSPSPRSAESLRAELADVLFDYLIPAVMVSFEAFPLLPGGKVDTEALRQAVTAVAAPAAGTARPAEVAVSEVIEACRAILPAVAAAELGPHSHFFDAGGTSLQAARLASSLSRTGGVPVPLELIFTHPRLDDLAEALGELGE